VEQILAREGEREREREREREKGISSEVSEEGDVLCDQAAAGMWVFPQLTHECQDRWHPTLEDTSHYIMNVITQRSIRAGFLLHVVGDHAGPSANTLVFCQKGKYQHSE
jgi:hypothetical protein